MAALFKGIKKALGFDYAGEIDEDGLDIYGTDHPAYEDPFRKSRIEKNSATPDDKKAKESKKADDDVPKRIEVRFGEKSRRDAENRRKAEQAQHELEEKARQEREAKRRRERENEERRRRESERTPDEQPLRERKDPIEAQSEGMSDQMMDGILGRLVEEMNKNLPPIVRSSIDVNAQKKTLYGVIGNQFHEYVKATRDNAVNEVTESFEAEKKDLEKRYQQARSRAAASDSKLLEMQDQMQELENQRKAATTRANERSSKLAKTESERLQLEMENKDLQNKIKVMQLHNKQNKNTSAASAGGADEELFEEITRLNEVENELRTKNAQVEKRVQELEAELAAAKSHDSADKDKEISTLKSQLKDANAELDAAAALQEKLEQFEALMTKKNDEIARLKAELADLEGKK